MDEQQYARAIDLLRGDIDWPQLQRLARMHGITPLLHKNLRRLGAERVPRAILDHLRAYALAIAQRNLILATELLHVLEVFEHHEIVAVPYKGPCLATSVYGNLGLREFADLDILVREQDVARAKALLNGQGFAPTKGGQLSWEAHFVRTRSGIVVNIDLHWRFTRRVMDQHASDPSFGFDLDDLWTRLGSAILLGRTVRQFSAEDFLLIRCQDAGKEYTMEHWPRLIWFCDIAELIRANPNFDWPVILRKAKQFDSRRLLLLYLLLSHELVNATLPGDLYRQAKRDRWVGAFAQEAAERLFCNDNVAFAERKLSYAARNLAYMRLKERPRAKVEHLMNIVRRGVSLLLISAFTLNERDRDFISLPKQFDFLYYLIKPIRLVGKYIRYIAGTVGYKTRKWWSLHSLRKQAGR